MWKPGAKRPKAAPKGGKDTPAASTAAAGSAKSPGEKKLSSATLGMKFMQKRAQREQEEQEAKERRLAEQVAKWRLEGGGSPPPSAARSPAASSGAAAMEEGQGDGEEEDEDGEETEAEAGEPGAGAAAAAASPGTGATPKRASGAGGGLLSPGVSGGGVVFEAEETDPRLQWMGRRSFGGFNPVVASIWEQNCEQFGLLGKGEGGKGGRGKKKRGRVPDEVTDEEMVERYLKRHRRQEHPGGGGGGSGRRGSGGGGGGGGFGRKSR